jgi:hypothetical protein
MPDDTQSAWRYRNTGASGILRVINECPHHGDLQVLLVGAAFRLSLLDGARSSASGGGGVDKIHFPLSPLLLSA